MASKIASVTITFEALQDLLDLPQDLRITDLKINREEFTINIQVSSTDGKLPSEIISLHYTSCAKLESIRSRKIF